MLQSLLQSARKRRKSVSMLRSLFGPYPRRKRRPHVDTGACTMVVAPSTFCCCCCFFWAIWSPLTRDILPHPESPQGLRQSRTIRRTRHRSRREEERVPCAWNLREAKQKKEKEPFRPDGADVSLAKPNSHVTPVSQLPLSPNPISLYDINAVLDGNGNPSAPRPRHPTVFVAPLVFWLGQRIHESVANPYAFSKLIQHASTETVW